MATALERDLEAARAERQELEDKLRGFAILDAGFDEAWAGVIKRTYDGPPDPEAIKAFAATEFGIGEVPTDDRQDDQ